MILLTGCTGSGDLQAGPRSTATGAPPGSTPTDVTEDPEVSEEVLPEGSAVLEVAVQDPSTLDPMRIQDPGSVLVARQLYEGLTRWDPSTQEVVPAAAEGWEVNDDGSAFRFTLRPGATFHDGSPVTSEHFKFAFDRIARRNSASDLAYTLDRVEGFTEVNQLGEARSLDGVRTPDDDTLVIRLSGPYHDFPLVLTHPGLVPLKRADVQDFDRFLAEPLGNGPFQMAAPWTPGEEVVLQAYPGYFETPGLDGIRFVPYQDAATSWVPFRDGELHVAEVPVGQFEAGAEEFGDEGYQPLLAGSYYGFNLSSHALSNKRVRRAVNAAIDREAIATSIYKGNMEVPRGIVPRGMPGFDDDLCEEYCSHDPETAKRIVNDLGNRQKRISLEYTKGQPHGRVARLIEADLEAAGFRVAVRAFGFPRFLRRLGSGDHGFYRLGWIAEYPSPDVFLSTLFGSGSPDNHTGFVKGRTDRLLERAHETGDAAERLELYRKAEVSVLEEYPVVPIGSFVTHWAVRPEVEGMTFDVTGGFDALGVTLEEE